MIGYNFVGCEWIVFILEHNYLTDNVFIYGFGSFLDKRTLMTKLTLMINSNMILIFE
jgi:hypothetical protein